MLEVFYKAHDYMVEHNVSPVRRGLMDELVFSDRLIAIKGSRGVGKTTFLLEICKRIENGELNVEWFAEENTLRKDAKERKDEARQGCHTSLSEVKNFTSLKRKCLYVDFNNFWFAQHTIVEFAEEFVRNGGRLLLLDQLFKYPNWAEELKICYDRFPELHIIFAISPVVRLFDETCPIHNIVKMYNLRGFSFREYLNLQSGQSFDLLKLEDILQHHVEIAQQITSVVNPLWYFEDYLHHGYYPFFTEKRSFEETLLKTMNMMLEVDILLTKGTDVMYLAKLRQVLYNMLVDCPSGINISRLADEVGVARITIMHYIKNLKDARLLNLLYYADRKYPQKPQKIYMQNPNLLYALPSHPVTRQALAETFFYNQMRACHKVTATDRSAMFEVDGKHYFNVYDRQTNRNSYRLSAVGDMQVGSGNVIPLWMIGFLY